MIRPIDDEIKLQQLDEASFKPQYSLQFNDFKKLVFTLLTPKAVGSSILNGASFLRLVDAYINCLNKGEIPIIEDAWKDVSKKEISSQIAAYIDIFKKEIVDI